MQSFSIPTAADFDAYRVNSPDYSQIIQQPLYDHLLYPAAGTQRLSFFQTGIGAGVTTALGGTVGAAKSYADTNMQLGGQLSSGINFMALSIEVTFFAGDSSDANTYDPAAPVIRAANAAGVMNQVLDANSFYQGGVLEFNVQSTNFYRNTPLLQFVPQRSFDLQGFAASTTAAIEYVGGNLRPGGAPIELAPPIALFSATAFDVTLTWPAAVATPSTFNGRVGVFLHGWMNRAGQ